MESKVRIYFLANVCHFCKSKNTCCTCEICKMIFYCTPDHRRRDWFEHSQICWAINKICESGHCECLWELYKGKDVSESKHEIARKCTELLRRPLKPWEFEMIYHPRVCSVCGEFDWKHLSFCKDCEFVYSCRKHHFRKDHVKWCKTMKLYSELIIHQSLRGETEVMFSGFQIKNNVFDSMADVLSKNCERKDECESFVDFEIQKALLSEVLTYPLTVLYALKKVIGLKKRRRIEILIIGAENQAEIEPLGKWERYLLHFLEDVKDLNLKFLGPELRMTTQKWRETLCDTCRKLGKNLGFECISGKFYHEYFTAGVKKPDLICAFNSGMYRDFGFENENSWKETIQKLFSNGNPPVLITEYTSRELEMVLERIENLCGNVTAIIRHDLNLFASLKPGLNIFSEDEAPVIFKNYYFSLLLKN